ncbi:hypothetical protein D9619_005427 [Psilocybe cf. subviscida]|uniref:Uncharacterized protein n=1 Tax=Psilocybe cf. subviscida TaxID=2480587 RepID=A0A8H5BWT5_9AGAR|nr:hypothetical protein D9619_005427 [Psilocybe cf. subviscida]
MASSKPNKLVSDEAQAKRGEEAEIDPE